MAKKCPGTGYSQPSQSARIFFGCAVEPSRLWLWLRIWLISVLGPVTHSFTICADFWQCCGSVILANRLWLQLLVQILIMTAVAPDLMKECSGTGYSKLHNLCGIRAVLRTRSRSNSAPAPAVGPDSYHDGCGSGFDEGASWTVSSQLHNLCDFRAVLRIHNLRKSALAPAVGWNSHYDGCGSGFG